MIRITAPTSALDHFTSCIHRCGLALQDVDAASELGRQRLWPIFILSSGRPNVAHLDWAVDHMLGEASAVQVIVVNPAEAADYRRAWPNLILLELPADKRAIGYSRHMIQKAFEWRTPFFWMSDDNIVGFVRVKSGVRQSDGALAHEALMHAQSLDISQVALVGFLRANGTEVLKSNLYLLNSPKLYKLVLINSRCCAGIEYVPDLCKFEDIGFANDLLRAARRTLKLQQYAYKVAASQQGGCSYSRERPDNILAHSCLPHEMSQAHWQTIQYLQSWLGQHMQKKMPARLQAERDPRRCCDLRLSGEDSSDEEAHIVTTIGSTSHPAASVSAASVSAASVSAVAAHTAARTREHFTAAAVFTNSASAPIASVVSVASASASGVTAVTAATTSTAISATTVASSKLAKRAAKPPNSNARLRDFVVDDDAPLEFDHPPQQVRKRLRRTDGALVFRSL